MVFEIYCWHLCIYTYMCIHVRGDLARQRTSDIWNHLFTHGMWDQLLTHMHIHLYVYTCTQGSRAVAYVGYLKSILPWQPSHLKCMQSRGSRYVVGHTWTSHVTQTPATQIAGCRWAHSLSLFCRVSSLLQGSFAKVTCNIKEPTNRLSQSFSHIWVMLHTHTHTHTHTQLKCTRSRSWRYITCRGVATIRKLLKVVGFFCRIQSL